MPKYREIISYPEMLQREGIALQKGMNFRIRGGAAGYSVILMSVRKGAPYRDQWHDEASSDPHAGMLEYEGHDTPRDRDSAIHPSVSRQIPTAVKVAVWKRDQGRCVECGRCDNLHFDHDVPFSKGGSSITAENVTLSVRAIT